MPIREPKYKPDQTIVKVIGYGSDRRIKVVNVNMLRTEGIEDGEGHGTKGTAGNEEKLMQSISRAKRTIFELAFCNPWDWFFTATLDPRKYDRTDLKKFHGDLTQWFRDYNKKHGISIKFLLIPELHSDGESWHMHGLIYGLPQDHLRQFVQGDVMGRGIALKVLKGDKVYNWDAYASKFGFCDLEPIRSAEAVSKYITKYISKSLHNSVTELNAHLYYHSRGLSTGEVIKKGTLVAPSVPKWDYENEYCRIATLPYSDDLLDQLKSSII